MTKFPLAAEIIAATLDFSRTVWKMLIAPWSEKQVAESEKY